MKKIILLLLVVFAGCSMGGYFSIYIKADIPEGHTYKVSVYHCQSGNYIGDGSIVYADTSYYDICIEVFDLSGETVFFDSKQIYVSQLNAEYNFYISIINTEFPEYEFIMK